CEQTRGVKLARLVALGDTLRSHVSKDQHASRNVSFFVTNRRGTIVDRTLRAVFFDQYRVIRESNHHAFPQSSRGRIPHRLARDFIDDAKHAFEWLMEGFLV